MAHAALSTAGANAALTTLASTYTWFQLHVGAPGAAGTANVATNTTRLQVTWSAPSGGAMSNTAALQWNNVPASEDYDHFTMWTASSGGTFGFLGNITATPVTAGDTFTILVGGLVVSLTVA